MLNKANKREKFYTHCSRFIQLTLVVFTIQTVASDLTLFKNFNPRVKIQDRTPQSFYADVDYTPKPEEYKTFLDYVFVYDKAGVLQRMSNHYHQLQERDEYVKNWDLSTTTIYRLSTLDERKRYFNKQFLRYIDKRISGSVKSAKKGSTLEAVGNMKDTLSPSSEAELLPNFKVKFRAKVLKGLATIKFINPYIDANTHLSLSDGVTMQLQKKFNDNRTIASVDYNPAGTTVEVYVEQAITNNLRARASSIDMVGGSNADHVLRINYHAPFNF